MTWFKDGKQIESDSLKGIYIEKKIESKVLYSSLVIKNSQVEDAGDYTCMSSNKDAENVQIHILDSKYLTKLLHLNKLRLFTLPFTCILCP